MRTFLLLALLATTQSISLNQKDDGATVPNPEKEQTCEKNKDGITFCISPGNPEWSLEMNHPVDTADKKYKSIKIQGDLKRGKEAGGVPPPLLKDPSSQMANAGLEMALRIKKEANATKNVTVNVTKNVTANISVNVSANASQNATKNATAAKK